MNTKYKFLSLVAAAAIMLPASTLAQGMGQQQGQGMGQGMGGATNSQMAPPPSQQGQQGQKGATPPAAAPAVPAVDPAEEAAWKKISTNTSTDPKVVAAEGEDFIKKFNSDPAKPSRYADRVYAQLAAAYLQLNDTQKMSDDLQKALTLNQNNVDALAIYAMVTSRRIDPAQPTAAAKEKQTEEIARHGIELLTALQKPEGAVDATFNRNRDEKLAMCHSGLGLAEYLEGKAADASQEFATATKLEQPPDPVDQYLLGTSLMDAKQFSASVTAFQDCLKDPGPMLNNCQKGLADAKKAAATQLSAPPKQ